MKKKREEEEEKEKKREEEIVGGYNCGRFFKGEYHRNNHLSSSSSFSFSEMV